MRRIWNEKNYKLCVNEWIIEYFMFKIIDGQNEFKGLISLDYLKYFIKLYKGSFTISALYTFWLFFRKTIFISHIF